MKLITLLENTACDPALAAAHGLSLYLETPKHKILFDMGPDGRFVENAEKLGVDLSAVDIAVLSHGHYDHGGGLRAFCAVNSQAEIYIHPEAFGEYYAVKPGQEPRYIGLEPDVWELESRIVPTADFLRLDEELTLFSQVPSGFSAMAASAKLQEKTPDGFRPDAFRHEQNLLVSAWGKTVLLAGCAHRGIVNILREAETLLGRSPDAVFAGFHLFELDGADPASDALITATGQALLPGNSVYYTGHCTGEYAYEKLRDILGDRLRPMTGGMVAEL